MISEKIIKFVEGELSIMEIEELEQEILKNPQLLEVIGGLSRIQKNLPPNQNLHDHIEHKKAQIRTKICATKQIEENILQDEYDTEHNEAISELIIKKKQQVKDTQEINELIEAIS